MKRRTGKSMLATAINQARTLLSDATDQELRAMARAIPTLSQTNCAWYVYQAREALRVFIETEREWRRQEARRQRRDARRKNAHAG